MTGALSLDLHTTSGADEYHKNYITVRGRVNSTTSSKNFKFGENTAGDIDIYLPPDGGTLSTRGYVIDNYTRWAVLGNISGAETAIKTILTNAWKAIAIYDRTITGQFTAYGTWMFLAYKYTGSQYGMMIAVKYSGARHMYQLNIIDGVFYCADHQGDVVNT